MLYLKKFNEQLEIESSNTYSFDNSEGLYRIFHNKFATDKFELGSTIVKASSKEEAMNILNNYLSTNPDGAYTSEPCKSIEDVVSLKVLSKK
jgi:hypothetical protein